MESLFIATVGGEYLIERHYRGLVGRKVCDEFWDALASASLETLKPILTVESAGGSDIHIVHLARHGLVYLAILRREFPPLLTLEFLSRLDMVLSDFFSGVVSEEKIKENFIVVYQILDEMVDFGFPNTTEPNILKDMIMPPSTLNAIMGGQMLAPSIPEGALSNIPWRRASVKYANNEIFIDLVERVNAIIDKSGTPIYTDCFGEVICNCHLSGIPDLTLTFINPQLLDDACFHPCVRYSRYTREKVISFVPPDGRFTLMKYRCGQSSIVQVPFSITHEISFHKGSGRIDIHLEPCNTQGANIEDVAVVIPLPECINNTNITCTQGTFIFDPIRKVGRWDAGKLTRERECSLTGSMTMMTDGDTTDVHPVLSVEFKAPMLCVSGLKVDALSLTGERYKPYKGMRTMSYAGSVEVRT
eukprot:GAFH01001221.1.p1 GENE.GAFH01001221.1~~GAFH01001221.1.p1  ORF type:complete len:432 (-),score=135.36 GAFH01001221.1:521-1771(-)